jgi:hypothetical protein
MKYVDDSCKGTSLKESFDGEGDGSTILEEIVCMRQKRLRIMTVLGL